MGAPGPRGSGLLLAAARAGREPAEALTPDDRVRLLYGLLVAGMTPAEIADWTRTTTYTVCRWLDTYGLRAPHTMRGGQAA